MMADVLAYIEGNSLRLYTITDDGIAEVGRLALTDTRPESVAAIVRGLKGMLAAPPKPEPEPTGMLALLNAKKAAPPATAVPRRSPRKVRGTHVSQADVLEWVRSVGREVDAFDVIEQFPELGDTPKAGANRLYPLMKSGYLVRTAPGKFKAIGGPLVAPRPEKAVALVATPAPRVERKPARRVKNWRRQADLLAYVRAQPGRTYAEIAADMNMSEKYVTAALRESGQTRLVRESRPAGVTTGSVPGRVYLREE